MEAVACVVGIDGVISFDVTKTDGAPGKLMNVSRQADLGCQYKASSEQG